MLYTKKINSPTVAINSDLVSTSKNAQGTFYADVFDFVLTELETRMPNLRFPLLRNSASYTKISMTPGANLTTNIWWQDASLANAFLHSPETIRASYPKFAWALASGGAEILRELAVIDDHVACLATYHSASARIKLNPRASTVPSFAQSKTVVFVTIQSHSDLTDDFRDLYSESLVEILEPRNI